MRFQYLGTAAAEAIPAIWCECETCRKAIAGGGKDIRRRASYLIDDDTIVDFGPDSYAQSLEFKIDLTKIKQVLFTHPHEDHLNVIDFISYRCPGFSVVKHPIRVLGSQKIIQRIQDVYRLYTKNDPDFKQYFMEPAVLTAGNAVTENGMSILPVPANHAPGLEPFIYAIERGGKSILIANDTGWLKEESWDLVLSRKYDMVSIDCTCGFLYPDSNDHHLGVNSALKFAERIRESGCVNPGCRILVTHFSHNGHALHEELEAFYRPHGIEVAYDGLVVEL